MKGPKPMSVIERISRKTIETATGCTVWTGAVNGKGGYGVILDQGNRRMTYVHRVMYIASKGEIPKGMVIDHLCRNRRCCNPDHLEAVDQATNLIRGMNKNFSTKREGICRNGHKMTEENIMIQKDGRKRCRECRNCRRRNHSKAKTDRIILTSQPTTVNDVQIPMPDSLLVGVK